MRRKHDSIAGRDVRQFFNKNRTFGAQIINHIGVMHDFMAHIDRRAELLQRAFNDFDRTVDPGTETARLRE